MDVVGYVILIAVGAAVARLWTKSNETKEPVGTGLSFAELADRLGVARTKSGVRGVMGPFTVTVQRHDRDVTIVVEREEPIAPFLRLTPMTSRVSATASRVITDDRFFDDRFQLIGPELEIVAAMTAPVRSGLSHHLGCQIEDGVMSCRTSALNARGLEFAVRRVVEIATMLCDERSVEASLRANALEDKIPAVRRRNLGLLVRRFGEARETQDVLVRAVEDPVPTNAYFAAKTIGGEIGRDFLLRFVAICERDADRLDAFRILVEEADWSAVLPLLEAAAYSDSIMVARRALRWIATNGSEADLAALLARVPPSAIFLADIVETVAVRLEGAAEPKLIRLLAETAFDANREGQERTIAMLERFGTPKSLEALRRAETSKSGLSHPHARAARAAIEAIKSRSSAGALTILETNEEGAVSLTPDKQGAVSFYKDEDSAKD